MRSSAVKRLGDEELMTLIARQDAAAFEAVYDRHGTAAYSLAHRIVGEPKAAEDVTQEALLSLWRSAHRYDQARGSVRGWILGIVRNRAIDFLRRTAGNAPQLDRDDDFVLEQRAAPDETEAEAIRRETAGDVRGALATLPPEQARVIRLAYFGGFSHAEIGGMLDIPLGTVKGRMRLGLEKIRYALAEGFAEPEVSQ